ncbi:DUF6350 family protein [Brevibacterium album]|uniref:cell division protein PerM n=1 Tax=Brevibacterium album TaxID=417948 RepID=UPI00048FD5FA|nr:DUF6350 family protein [Brevibacterium album]
MSQAPNPSPSASRHPIAIGVLESVRALVLVAGASFLCAAAAWFVAIAQQQPISVIPVWAGGLIGAASGWAMESATTLPPTLLTAALVLVLAQAFGRTRRALAVNAALVRSGRIPEVEHARALGTGAVVLTSAVWLLLAGLLVGPGTAGPLGTARFLLVLAAAFALAFLTAGRSDRRAARRAARRRGSRSATRAAGDRESAGWAETLRTWVQPRLGEQWGEAVEDGLRLTGRTWAGLAVLALVLLAAALVLGRQSVAEALAAYSDPVAAAVGLAAVQALFGPTILLLVLSWASGAGVWMSATVLASPGAGFEGPVPAVPVLAVVPAQPPAWSGFLVIALVLTGLGAAIGRRAWAERLDWRTVLVHVCLMAAVTAVLALFCTGAIGPDGLSRFGAPVGTATLLITGATALGATAGWGLRLLADRRES